MFMSHSKLEELELIEKRREKCWEDYKSNNSDKEKILLQMLFESGEIISLLKGIIAEKI
jgi:hypothetical protein